MLTSCSNRVLTDIRDDAPHLETGTVGAARVTLDYLEYSFGSVALNDGFYTPEEINHAHRVLTKFLAVYA